MIECYLFLSSRTLQIVTQGVTSNGTSQCGSCFSVRSQPNSKSELRLAKMTYDGESNKEQQWHI